MVHVDRLERKLLHSCRNTELVEPIPHDEEQKDDTTVRLDANRQVLHYLRKAIREVCLPVLRTAQPGHVRRPDQSVQRRQAIDDLRRRHRPTEPAVGVANSPVQRLVPDVIDPPAMVATGVRDGVPPSNQPLEQVHGPLAVLDAGKGRELARHADTGVLHDGHQKPSLTLGEAVSRNPSDAIDGTHRRTFEGSNGAPPI